MKRYKRLLAVLLAAGMVFTMLPAGVHAEETDMEELILEQENDGIIPEETEDSAEVIAAEEAGMDLEYLYVGEQYVTVTDAQEIVAVFSGEGKEPVEGTLYYTVGEDPEEHSVQAADIADTGILFQIGEMESEEDGTIVSLTRMTYAYTAEGSEEVQEEEIVLADIEIDASYTLCTEEQVEATVAIEEPDLDESQVLDPEELAELEAEESEMPEDGITVYVADPDSEELQEVDSIEEAIEIAAAEYEAASEENAGLVVEEGEENLAGIPKFIVALDPGHDKVHTGAGYGGYKEENLNLAVALICKAELETYAGVEVYMTRATADCPNDSTGSAGKDNVARIDKAVQAGARVYVAIHMNAATSTTANGAEVYIPNKNYKSELFTEGSELGTKILQQLEALGLKNRGTVVTNSTDNTRYPDGSLADYYTVNEECKRRGITGIIIEHGFMSNSDNLKYLASEEGIRNLGVADATAIAQQYNLVKESELPQDTNVYHVEYQGHVQSIGWNTPVMDGGSAGTSGRSLRMEALKIRIVKEEKKNGKTVMTPVDGAITYKAHVQTYGWMNWVKDFALSGTTGQAKRVEAMQIKLTGDLADQYDIWYRVHSQRVGWLGWAKNGAMAGTADNAFRMEDMQIKLVKKGGPAPGDTRMPFYSNTCRGDVTYRANVESYGWMAPVADGAVCGTEGQGKRLEDIKIWVDNPIDPATGEKIPGNVVYRTHVQTYGWLDWVQNGEDAGTEGEGKRIESIQIKLTGELAEKYDIYYRTHCQTYGTLGWAKNGVSAGTAGYAKRVESLQIKLVDKNDQATIAALEKEGTDSSRVSPDSMYFRALDSTGKGQSFKLTAYNTHSIEVFQKVEFEVWNTKNGKDDVKTYSGTQAAEGTWNATMETANHGGLGSYSANVYGVRSNGTKVLLGSLNFTASERVIVPITVTTGAEMSAQEVFNYLVKSGLTKEGAAGLMGNLYAESGIRPNNLQNSFEKKLEMNDQEYTAAVDNGSYTNFVRDSAGYGLAQWTYWSRKEELMNFRNAAGTSIGNCKMQLDFLLKELRGYTTLYKTLTTTDSVAAASKDVLQIYEKPATYKEASTIALRESYSMSMYNQYAK